MRYVAPPRIISGNWRPGGGIAKLMLSLRKGHARGSTDISHEARFWQSGQERKDKRKTASPSVVVAESIW